jgi:transcriptional regulator with XRE-family HTH domain
MDQGKADIGSRLRQARQRRGLSLRDIANVTKISTLALKAIERNEFGRLPGGVFRRAYVRAFAAEVGLDADELVREYRSRFDPEPVADSQPTHGAGWNGGGFRLGGRAAGAVVGLGLLAGGLLLSRPAQVPQMMPDEELVLSERATGLPDSTALTTESEGVAPSLATAVAATRDAAFRVEMRFTGWCWVSAAADGERVLHRLMRPGETTLIEAQRTITLRLGDASAVIYSVNGAAGQPLGGKGEAVTVQISSDSVDRLHGEPPSEPPEDPGDARLSPRPARHGQEANRPRESAV